MISGSRLERLIKRAQGSRKLFAANKAAEDMQKDFMDGGQTSITETQSPEPMPPDRGTVDTVSDRDGVTDPHNAVKHAATAVHDAKPHCRMRGCASHPRTAQHIFQPAVLQVKNAALTGFCQRGGHSELPVLDETGYRRMALISIKLDDFPLNLCRAIRIMRPEFS